MDGALGDGVANRQAGQPRAGVGPPHDPAVGADRHPNARCVRGGRLGEGQAGGGGGEHHPDRVARAAGAHEASVDLHPRHHPRVGRVAHVELDEHGRGDPGRNDGTRRDLGAHDVVDERGSAVAEHQQPVADEDQPRGLDAVEREGGEPSRGGAGDVHGLQAAAGDAEDRAAVGLHDVRLVDARLLQVRAREVDPRPRSRKGGRDGRPVGGVLGRHPQERARPAVQPVRADHLERTVAHVAEERPAGVEALELRRRGRGRAGPAASEDQRRRTNRHQHPSTHDPTSAPLPGPTHRLDPHPPPRRASSRRRGPRFTRSPRSAPSRRSRGPRGAPR